MKTLSYIPENEIAVNSFEDAVTIAKILLKNHNAVLLTEEEDLTIVNWVWCQSSQSNRNDVVFMDRCSFEENFQQVENEKEDSDEELI